MITIIIEILIILIKLICVGFLLYIGFILLVEKNIIKPRYEIKKCKLRAIKNINGEIINHIETYAICKNKYYKKEYLSIDKYNDDMTCNISWWPKPYLKLTKEEAETILKNIKDNPNNFHIID